MFDEKNRASRRTKESTRKEKTTDEVIYPGAQGNFQNTSRKRGTDLEDDNGFPAEVNKTMSKIKYRWEFMMAQDFNPIPHALSIFEAKSASGVDYSSFVEMYNELEMAMDLIVNDYHEAFNNAIHKFSIVVENISESKTKTLDMKKSLDKCKDWLECKRFDLLHLWVKSLQNKEMTRILDLVVELQKTPEKIESFIQRKFYLCCVQLLISSIRIVDGGECGGIGALENIKQQLFEIRNGLFETLMDELNDHIYLKTSSMTSFKEPIPSFDEEIQEDLDCDPTKNSYMFIRSIIEALYTMGKLREGIQIIREKLSLELYYVIERCIQDIEIKYSKNNGLNLERVKNGIGGLTAKEKDFILLRNLLLDIYLKFERITRTHRFIIELIRHIVVKRNLQDEFSDKEYTIAEVFTTAQNEIKSLLNEYLNANAEVNDSSVPFLTVQPRVKRKEAAIKRIFKVSLGQMNPEVYDYYQSIDPNPTKTQNQEQDTLLNSAGMVDKYADTVSTQHKLLVDPDPYHILIAYHPSSDFIDVMESILVGEKGHLVHYLDDFILNRLLPEMETRVIEYFHNHVNGMDAFTTEIYPALSKYPLIKSTVALLILVKGMSSKIQSIPAHRHEFIKIIEIAITKFIEKCEMKFKVILTTDQSDNPNQDETCILSAQWAENAKLKEYLQLLEMSNKQDKDQILLNEMKWEFSLKKERSIHRSELLFENRKIQSLANLHHSLKWLRQHILEMINSNKDEIEDAEILIKSEESRSFLNYLNSDSFASLDDLLIDESQTQELPLQPDMILRFEIILQNYKKLEDLCLFLLRLEIRTHTIYYLDLALIEGNYYVEDESTDPDPYVGSLNQDLTMIEEIALQSLSTRRCRFLFEGLAPLMSQLLKFNLSRIKKVNNTGVNKLIRNVQSLQQNLTNLVSATDKYLETPKQYYELLLKSDEDMIKSIQNHPNRFDYDELKVLLDLKYQDDDKKKEDYIVTLGKIKSHFVSNNIT